MLAAYFINVNWVLIILSVICAGLSIQEYKKSRKSIAMLSALAWASVAILTSFGLWAQ